ncbi:porin family protein [Robertkochia sediminum]|uniref:porin family protein n=1 Tax=Robertkochia sediminum TaxID=2785326 RepID=UPI001934212A|nr:porin family protein [Robertkochia sediminum]MBL7472512.1 PorT family protein [Robertkochia sediminum]
MKKFVLLICLMAGITAFAQSNSGYGVKGGFNFNSSGDLDLGDINLSADTQTGFHLGVWGKFGENIYLRPELVYTKINSKYEGRSFSSDFEMQKLDLPVLVGIKILGPINLFGGPSLQYVLNSDLNDVDYRDVENDFTVGLQFGVGVDLGDRLGVDLRYERGLGSNEAEFADDILGTGRVDTRPSQFILSLALKL